MRAMALTCVLHLISYLLAILTKRMFVTICFYYISREETISLLPLKVFIYTLNVTNYAHYLPTHAKLHVNSGDSIEVIL